MSPPPIGAPLALFVEGILDGRILNEDALRLATDQLSQSGAGAFQLEITGGRFNLMPSDSFVQPENFGEAAQNDFLEGLKAISEAAQPGSIETNLRCKMIFESDVEEVLFLARGPLIEPVTRRRPRTPEDKIPLDPVSSSESLGLRRRELIWIGPVLLVLGLILAWQSGWIDRVLAARAEQIQAQTGPFGDMIDVRLERSWGTYLIELERGTGYPADPKALAARQESSSSLTARAACELVGNGGTLFVALLNKDGGVLVETRAELRPLLGDADGRIRVSLPGQMSADRLVLSLSSSARKR